MADVTAEAGEKMVKTLQKMTDANKEMETMRLEVQSKMHLEQMEYKQDRDRMEMENMSMALLNQGMVVNAISSLTEAIGRTAGHTVPPPNVTSTAWGAKAAGDPTQSKEPMHTSTAHAEPEPEP
ncbi:hypothetical protein M758_6G041100 [Ceratodon purpureus]|nr:hypothetical protein M758_6G041100 [Ceratodon purpureus]